MASAAPTMQLDPNRFAAPQEAEILREHIATDEATLQALRDRLGRASTILHDAERKRVEAQEAEESARTVHGDIAAMMDELEQRITKMRGKLHPVKLVPVDIWRSIFLICVDFEFDDMEWDELYGWNLLKTPFVASSVCRRWRAAALDAPELWNKVVFDHARALNPLAWVEYMRVCRSRSGSRELVLKIICNAAEASATVNREVGWYVVPRCRRIEVEIHDVEAARDVLQAWTTPSKLEELVMTCPDHCDYTQDPVVILPEVAPALKVLVVSHVNIKTRGTLVPLPALTRASIKVKAGSVAWLDGVRQLFPSLESLTLDVGEFYADLQAPVIWPGLKHLSLSATQAEDGCAVAFRFPHLQHLELAHDHAVTWDFWGLFGLTACSAVRQLTLRKQLPATALAAMSALAYVTSLTFKDECAVDEALCAALLAGEDGRWPFPRLATVAFDGVLVPDNAQLEHLQRAIVARREAFSDGKLKARLSLASFRHTTMLPVPVGSMEWETRIAEAEALVASWNLV